MSFPIPHPLATVTRRRRTEKEKTEESQELLFCNHGVEVEIRGGTIIKLVNQSSQGDDEQSKA